MMEKGEEMTNDERRMTRSEWRKKGNVVTEKGECVDGKMNLQGKISKIGKDYFGKVPYLCPRNSK